MHFSSLQGFKLTMENVKKKCKEEQLELPEPIIHHIQSFLSTKEAATASILSKSWYNSWLTRPFLDFDDRTFNFQYPTFFNFVRNTLEKCHELNLSINSFKLSMRVSDIQSSPLATESIVQAVKLGVDNMEIFVWDRPYVLPTEVFESESLKILSVSNCKIDGISKVRCSKLESLSLSGVEVGDDTMRDIISGCPLLKILMLFGRRIDSSKIDMSKLALSLEKLTANEYALLSIMDCLSSVPVFHKLSCLDLESVKIDSILFHDFSNKFPCIEDLTVWCCSGCMTFDISTQSLEYPSFCSQMLDCDVEISWFGELNNLLTHLSGSKITLKIDLPSYELARGLLDFHNMPKPAIVENLTLVVINSMSVCSAFLDAVFWTLQPKFITQRFFPIPHNRFGKATNAHWIRPHKGENKLLQLLYKKLVGLEKCKGSSSSGTRRGICWNKLEEVNAESFDDTCVEWRPMPWKTFLADIMGQEKEVQIRFRLIWVHLMATSPTNNTNHKRSKEMDDHQKQWNDSRIGKE